MDKFLQLAFQGLSLGCIYALIALGFVIVFKSSSVFNFAHAVFVMISAYIVVSFPAKYFVWGVLAALAGMIIIAVASERTILRRLAGQSLWVVVMATLGLSVMAQAMIAIIWGVAPMGSTEGPIGRGTVQVGGVILSKVGIWITLVSAVLLLALWMFFQKTRHGLALRAAADHHEAALAQGISMRRVQTMAWAIAGVLAVAAGIFLGAYPRQVHPGMSDIAMGALPAIIIGGFASLAGAVVGGIVVGMALVLGAGYLSTVGPGDIHTVLPYVIMLAILVFRPSGLFGQGEAERI